MVKEEPQNQYLWAKILQLARMFYDNGVALISESDISNLNWFLGLACIMSLKFRKNQDPGKQAGMIILSDNPVDEITNTKKIEGVINNGQFIE